MNKKLWLGILTFMPFLFVVFYGLLFLFHFSNFITDASGLSESEISEFVLQNILWILTLIILNVVISLGLLVYYLIHVNKSTLDTNLKILWSILLIIFITITGIVYYFLYILPENNSQDKKNDKNRLFL